MVTEKDLARMSVQKFEENKANPGKVTYPDKKVIHAKEPSYNKKNVTEKDLARMSVEKHEEHKQSVPAKPKPIQAKEPSFRTGTDIKIDQIKNINQAINEQIKNIDSDAQYIVDGEKISGRKLQIMLMKDKIGAARDISRMTPGVYVEKNDRYYKFTPEMQYIYGHSTPEQKEKIIWSLGIDSSNPQGRSEFQKIFSKGYSSLSQKEKEEYGYRFTDWASIDPVDIKNYPGGKKYLQENKEKILDRYLQNKSTKEIISKNIGLSAYKYATVGGSYGKQKMDDPKFLKNLAWDQIRYTEENRKERYFSKLPAPVRWYSSAHNAFISGVSYPIVLPQTAMKYARGKGEMTDVLGRISSGKTYLPDVGKFIDKHKPGGPSGLISTGISTGLSKITGNVDKSVERFVKYPVSGAFATGGEVLGLLTGGYGLAKTKQFIKPGLYRVGTPIKQGFVSRGWMKNLPLSRYGPKNIIRTGYWKARTYFGKAKYIPEEKVWSKQVVSGSKKFAEARNVTEMVQKFYDTQGRLGGSADDLLGIHAADHQFHSVMRVKPGTSETAGLSISAFGEGSPHFLRTTGNISGLSSPIKGVSIIPKIKMPTAIITRFKSLYRLPKHLRKPIKNESTSMYYTKISKYMQKQPPGSYAHIAAKAELGGPEIEAIIRSGKLGSGQWLKKASSKYWTTYQGKTVPLPEYTLSGSGIPGKSIMVVGKSTATRSGRFLKKAFSPYSYGTSQTVPLISPSYVVSSFGSYPASSSPVSSFKSSKSLISSSRSISSSKLRSVRRSYQSYRQTRSASSSRSSVSSEPSIASSSSKSYQSIPSPLSSSFKSYSAQSPSSRIFDPFSSSKPYFGSYKRSYGKKTKNWFNDIEKEIGYRQRTWKVPKLSDYFKGG